MYLYGSDSTGCKSQEKQQIFRSFKTSESAVGLAQPSVQWISVSPQPVCVKLLGCEFGHSSYLMPRLWMSGIINKPPYTPSCSGQGYISYISWVFVKKMWPREWNVSRSASQSIGESASQSVRQSASHSVIPSIGESVSQLFSQSVSQSASHSVNRWVSHSVNRWVSQSVSQATADPATARS